MDWLDSRELFLSKVMIEIKKHLCSAGNSQTRHIFMNKLITLCTQNLPNPCGTPCTPTTTTIYYIIMTMHQRPVLLMTTQWTNLNCNKSRVEEHHTSASAKNTHNTGCAPSGFGNLKWINSVPLTRSTVLIWNSHISKMGSSIRALKTQRHYCVLNEL